MTVAQLKKLFEDLVARVVKLEEALLQHQTRLEDHRQQTEYQLTKDAKLARILGTGKKKQ